MFFNLSGRSMIFILEVLPGNYVICRIEPSESIPEWARGDFVSVTRTRDELSIVFPDRNVPDDVQSERGWRCLRVAGKLDFLLVGVIATITSILADADISTFVVSTFETDYLLVRELDLDGATAALLEAGHSVSNSSGHKQA
jgi:hypothetical protein